LLGDELERRLRRRRAQRARLRKETCDRDVVRRGLGDEGIARG
jgi:hypothetical protein